MRTRPAAQDRAPAPGPAGAVRRAQPLTGSAEPFRHAPPPAPRKSEPGPGTAAAFARSRPGAPRSPIARFALISNAAIGAFRRHAPRIGGRPGAAAGVREFAREAPERAASEPETLRRTRGSPHRRRRCAAYRRRGPGHPFRGRDRLAIRSVSRAAISSFRAGFQHRPQAPESAPRLVRRAFPALPAPLAEVCSFSIYTGVGAPRRRPAGGAFRASGPAAAPPAPGTRMPPAAPRGRDNTHFGTYNDLRFSERSLLISYATTGRDIWISNTRRAHLGRPSRPGASARGRSSLRRGRHESP